MLTPSNHPWQKWRLLLLTLLGFWSGPVGGTELLGNHWGFGFREVTSVGVGGEELLEVETDTWKDGRQTALLDGDSTAQAIYLEIRPQPLRITAEAR